MTPDSPSPEESRVGLCLRCRHQRRVEAKGGSVFFLCRLSAEDPSYPRYPALPVLGCRGYEPVGEDGGKEPEPG